MKKLCVGVDVSEKELTVAYWDLDKPVFIGTYPNTHGGFQAIRRRIEELPNATEADAFVHLVMEPTGGYEQPFAHFAVQQGWRVSLPNPLRPKQWAKAMGKRAKTDPQDAKNLAHYAFAQDPLPWKPLPAEVQQLEHLLNRQDDLLDMLQREKNRAHSAEYMVNPHEAVSKDMAESISNLEQRIGVIQEAIKEHLKANPHLGKQKKLLLTVSGIGERNVLYILVALHGWGVLTDGKGSAKGLVAYLGLDPVPYQSGSSIHRKARISRQGNRPLRSRLYVGALGGVGGNNPLRAFYQRLVGRGKPKKLALVAAARKILVWAWAVFRTNTPFDVTRFNHIH
jgi:transposase